MGAHVISFYGREKRKHKTTRFFFNQMIKKLSNENNNSSEESIAFLTTVQEMWVRSMGWEDPLEKKDYNTFQYSCLGNHVDQRAWWAIVH